MGGALDDDMVSEGKANVAGMHKEVKKSKMQGKEDKETMKRSTRLPPMHLHEHLRKAVHSESQI
ncbi:hypothetical protein SESBI_44615 [Sesbania bispinosa]|nr:hypothetical protein SESBI_44615 [Sesbania bispinosa]